MLNKKIPYQIKVSRRARNLRIAVYEGGKVVVIVPWFLGMEKAAQFVGEKTNWILKKLEYFKNVKPSVFPRSSKREYKKYKNLASHLAMQKVEKWNSVYGFKYNRINIKNQKTRWGSCSKKGNLNFNYKIVHLPEKVLDYLVVHELCHLKEFNHSKNFWDLIGKAIPGYAKLRKELKSI